MQLKDVCLSLSKLEMDKDWKEGKFSNTIWLFVLLHGI